MLKYHRFSVVNGLCCFSPQRTSAVLHGTNRFSTSWPQPAPVEKPQSGISERTTWLSKSAITATGFVEYFVFFCMHRKLSTQVLGRIWAPGIHKVLHVLHPLLCLSLIWYNIKLLYVTNKNDVASDKTVYHVYNYSAIFFCLGLLSISQHIIITTTVEETYFDIPY